MNRSFPTSEANLRSAFAQMSGEIHVHLEAGELAPWAASIIAPLVKRVVCSHPRENAWIAKDGDKCDRVDAYKLAELLRLNRFKAVHYAPDQPRRDFKQLVLHYDELTAHQARWKTKLKARLRMQGVIVTGERLFSSSASSGAGAQKREAVVRPVNEGTEQELLYRNWVEQNRAYVARISNGWATSICRICPTGLSRSFTLT